MTEGELCPCLSLVGVLSLCAVGGAVHKSLPVVMGVQVNVINLGVILSVYHTVYSLTYI